MNRIYLEYAKNITLSNLGYIIPSMFLVVLFMSISIQNIFSNMPKDSVSGLFNFFIVAIKDTEWVIQLTVVVIALYGSAALLKFAYKNVESIKSFLPGKLLRIRY